MKICLINNLYKPFDRGGADRITEVVGNGLYGRGYEVFVIATKPISFQITNNKSQITNKSKIQNPKFKTYYIPGLFYYLGRVPVFLRLVWHLVDMFDMGMYLKVRKILKNEKPEIVITNNLKGLSYLLPGLIRSLRIRHIHILHDIQLIHPSGLMNVGEEKKIDSLFAKIYTDLCRRLFGSPDVVVSPSGWLMGMHEKRNFFKLSKKIIIPNPVELPDAGQRSVNKSGIFNFLFVGQLEKHKGILDLVSAFRDVSKNRNCRLDIIGDGSELYSLQKKAGDDKNISFHGRINDKAEILRRMAEADCLVVPSRCYENSPGVIYEAFSAGTVVLASDVGGIPEIVDGSAGFLFKAGDVADLKEKMVRFIDMDVQVFESMKIKAAGKMLGLKPGDYLNKLEKFF